MQRDLCRLQPERRAVHKTRGCPATTLSAQPRTLLDQEERMEFYSMYPQCEPCPPIYLWRPLGSVCFPVEETSTPVNLFEKGGGIADWNSVLLNLLPFGHPFFLSQKYGANDSAYLIVLLPLWLSWWRICLQCGRPGFDPWVGKIPWRRERLPTSVFWPGEFQRLYSPWGHKESDTTERLSLSHRVILRILAKG